MSLAAIPGGGAPLQRTKIVAGTRTQISPVTNTPHISVAPMPIMKAPWAPPVGECESPPTTNMPGLRWPFSGSTTWQMPCMS